MTVTPAAVEATLRGEEGSTITFRVGERRPDHGAEALGGTIAVEVLSLRGSFHASCGVVIPASDVAQFTDALGAMDRTLGGEATLGLDPDYFQLRVQMTAGQTTIEGIVYETWDTQLRFGGIRTDQTFVSESLSQFKRIVDAFPAARESEP